LEPNRARASNPKHNRTVKGLKTLLTQPKPEVGEPDERALIRDLYEHWVDKLTGVMYVYERSIRTLGVMV